MEINEAALFNLKPISIVAQKLQALPPYAQRLREIMAILSDERLHEMLGNESIESIERNEHGYLIATEKLTMQVNVYYDSASRCCGPQKFRLEFLQPVPR